MKTAGKLFLASLLLFCSFYLHSDNHTETTTYIATPSATGSTSFPSHPEERKIEDQPYFDYLIKIVFPVTTLIIGIAAPVITAGCCISKGKGNLKHGNKEFTIVYNYYRKHSLQENFKILRHQISHNSQCSKRSDDPCKTTSDTASNTATKTETRTRKTLRINVSGTTTTSDTSSFVTCNDENIDVESCATTPPSSSTNTSTPITDQLPLLIAEDSPNTEFSDNQNNRQFTTSYFHPNILANPPNNTMATIEEDYGGELDNVEESSTQTGRASLTRQNAIEVNHDTQHENTATTQTEEYIAEFLHTNIYAEETTGGNWIDMLIVEIMFIFRKYISCASKNDEDEDPEALSQQY